MSVMKIHYKKLGGHYHCTVYTARTSNVTYACNGALVFDEREFPDVKLIISGAQFIDEKEPES